MCGGDDGSLQRIRDKKKLQLRQQLAEMGYEDWLVDEAVEEGSVDKALAFIDRQLSALEPAPEQRQQQQQQQQGEVEGEALALLMSMGFEEEACRAALEAAGNNLELAVDILGSQ